MWNRPEEGPNDEQELQNTQREQETDRVGPLEEQGQTPTQKSPLETEAEAEGAEGRTEEKPRTTFKDWWNDYLDDDSHDVAVPQDFENCWQAATAAERERILNKMALLTAPMPVFSEEWRRFDVLRRFIEEANDE